MLKIGYDNLVVVAEDVVVEVLTKPFCGIDVTSCIRVRM
jgi:hypothetical protein